MPAAASASLPTVIAQRAGAEGQGLAEAEGAQRLAEAREAGEVEGPEQLRVLYD